MEVKFKRLHPDAVIPTKGSKQAAGYDLTAISREWDSEHQVWNYGTGIAIELPEGYEAQLRSRSSIYKTGLILSNGTGTIDSDYRGEIMAKFYPVTFDFHQYSVGDRIAQLVIHKVEQPLFVEVSELTATECGEGGYGSTGK